MTSLQIPKHYNKMVLFVCVSIRNHVCIEVLLIKDVVLEAYMINTRRYAHQGMGHELNSKEGYP
jgi:hypothetical protein